MGPCRDGIEVYGTMEKETKRLKMGAGSVPSAFTCVVDGKRMENC
jgi:hypothetical protein